MSITNTAAPRGASDRRAFLPSEITKLAVGSLPRGALQTVHFAASQLLFGELLEHAARWELSSLLRAVLAALWRRANRPAGWRVTASQRDLARLAGCCERVIPRALRQLEAHGFVERAERSPDMPPHGIAWRLVAASELERALGLDAPPAPDAGTPAAPPRMAFRFETAPAAVEGPQTGTRFAVDPEPCSPSVVRGEEISTHAHARARAREASEPTRLGEVLRSAPAQGPSPVRSEVPRSAPAQGPSPVTELPSLPPLEDLARLAPLELAALLAPLPRSRRSEIRSAVHALNTRQSALRRKDTAPRAAALTATMREHQEHKRAARAPLPAAVGQLAFTLAGAMDATAREELQRKAVEAQKVFAAMLRDCATPGERAALSAAWRTHPRNPCRVVDKPAPPGPDPLLGPDGATRRDGR